MVRVIQDAAPVGRLSPGHRESLPDLDELARPVESEAKRNLARELHDSMAQILTLMVVDMEHFKLDVAGQQTLVSGIDRLQESGPEVLHNLREVLYDLREEPAMDSGLVRHLSTLLDHFEESTGIGVRLHVSTGWPSLLSRRLPTISAGSWRRRSTTSVCTAPRTESRSSSRPRVTTWF